MDTIDLRRPRSATSAVRTPSPSPRSRSTSGVARPLPAGPGTRTASPRDERKAGGRALRLLTTRLAELVESVMEVDGPDDPEPSLWATITESKSAKLELVEYDKDEGTMEVRADGRLYLLTIEEVDELDGE